ncbi:MAG: aldo/keto reductase [Aggregatilineales bacterium]
MSIASTITLNNGVNIPRLGLGVYRSPAGDTTIQAVSAALEAGYRHIDTAMIYGNERAVGKAVRESGIPRDEVFVTTKLWNDDHGYESALRACDKSLSELGLDVIDLYLIHWPLPEKRLDTWRAFEKLLADGKVRAIGVSNYMAHHLTELLANSETVPAINQIELSPYNYGYRQSTVDVCRENGIVLEAYSPLTKGRKLNDPALTALAAKYNKSAAQILIRWVIQIDAVVIPKSVNPVRIAENGDVFDFEISADDMDALNALNENLVTGWDPTDAP